MNREYNYKRLWFCYKFSSLTMFYISFFLWHREYAGNDFVFFKVDYSRRSYFFLIIFNFYVVGIFKGKLVKLLGVDLWNKKQ